MRPPPIRLVRLVTSLSDGLQKVRRRLLPPPYAALDLGTMSWVAMSVAAFCELQLPQALAQKPRTAAELASDGYGREERLFRLLRGLAAYGVTKHRRDGRFALGHAGKGLMGEDSVAPMLRYANAGWHVAAYARLAESIRGGRPGFDLANGAPMFEYYAANPQAGAIFDAAMESLTKLHGPPLAHAYDFSATPHVVDIGGGTGSQLAAILERHAGVRGTIFELPAVAERAQAAAASRGFGERLTVVAGDVFQTSPPQADAYIFSHVLHDWDDASCERMLSNVRRTMPPHARVLIYEIVAAPPNNRWSQDRISDLEMLAMLPGRERTREQFAALLKRSGLRLARIWPAATAESVLEAVPA